MNQYVSMLLFKDSISCIVHANGLELFADENI